MEKNCNAVSKLLFGETSNKTPNQLFEDELRNKLQTMRNERLGISTQNSTENSNFQNIADFIKQHVLAVGKEQAVKDFQCGLNFLHKDLIVPLKEDGDFGEKTFKAFYEIFKFYDVEIIKNAIRKGAISNTVIGTSSDKTVNTHSMVERVNNNLGELK